MSRKVDNRYADSAALVSGTLQYQARANPRTNPKLSKELFPSSSPNAPRSSQNGNIKDAFQKSFSTKPGSHISSGPQTAAGGLNARRSTTPLAPASGNPYPNAAPRFQSVCTASSDPFADKVDGKEWNGKNYPTIDEDFAWLEENDDDLDDLDLPEPAPAPVLPAAHKPSPPLPPAAPINKHTTLGSSQGAQIPWSSSPPHHMYPPITRNDSGTSSTSSHTLKRKSPETIAPESAPKRRSLPFATNTGQEVITIKDEDAEDVKATPAAKPGRYDPLEATASAMNEQRKLHKLQRTQSGWPEPDKPSLKATDLSIASVKA
ncbi:hypothetical protein IMZ48_48425, partial [Candidatus Bathyarchaeota archaeon]|nr:hypothetical protein [Candidatus Bathyarchaeota archaeon]